MATDIARRMITEWGMGDKLGFQSYGDQQQELFIGQAITQRKQISERTAELIDKEVLNILDTCYKEAYQILTDKLDKLHLLASTLLECETLSGDEIKDLLEKGTPPPTTNTDTKSTPAMSFIPETSIDA